jgi:predicted alpha/beta hydrolase family esterase
MHTWVTTPAHDNHEPGATPRSRHTFHTRRNIAMNLNHHVDDDDSGATTRRTMLRAAAAVVAVPLTVVAGREAAYASPPWPAVKPSGQIRKAVLVPRYGGDAASDWYRWLIEQLGDLGIKSTVVPLLPKPDAPAVDQTVAAIAEAVGDDPKEYPHTLLVGHSVGSRALLAYLNRRKAGVPFAGLVPVAGWFTLDDSNSYPALVPWVELDLDYAAIASKAGPITVHLSDDDPFTRNWANNAAEWLSTLTASVHITHGAGHFMTPTAPPVLDTLRAAGFAGRRDR